MCYTQSLLRAIDTFFFFFFWFEIKKTFIMSEYIFQTVFCLSLNHCKPLIIIYNLKLSEWISRETAYFHPYACFTHAPSAVRMRSMYIKYSVQRQRRLIVLSRGARLQSVPDLRLLTTTFIATFILISNPNIVSLLKVLFQHCSDHIVV